MDWHFANALERVADLVPDRTALICGDKLVTWRDYDDRAARLCAVLAARGVPAGGKVGLYLSNCNGYLESQFGIFKLRACPINVNYRYKAEELVYLLQNAEAEAVVYQASFAPRIAEIRHRLPGVKCLIQIDDGCGEPLLDGALDYEASITAAQPAPRIARNPNDLYMLYTGGTTGMPKGVMYRNGEFCEELAKGYRNFDMTAPRTVDEIDTYLDEDKIPVSLVACPLMHGTGAWCGALMPHLAGATVVTISSLGLDPHLIWREVERCKVTYLTIVGDAFARPLLNALDEGAGAYDLSSMKTIISSGVMWSREVKEGLLKHHDFTLLDAMGSSEGSIGVSVSNRDTVKNDKTAKFKIGRRVKVFDEHDCEVAPGSGAKGMIAARSAMIGYFKDPEKTAKTIREIDGVHYVFAGDFATVEADRTITLLGRGSMCINTAGEKVFPEEV